jgi:hypothetical protein
MDPGGPHLLLRAAIGRWLGPRNSSRTGRSQATWTTTCFERIAFVVVVPPFSAAAQQQNINYAN